MKFFLRISSVNLTKSTVYCRFGHIDSKNAYLKTSFSCAVSERALSIKYLTHI